jgi:hypothetical protein
MTGRPDPSPGSSDGATLDRARRVETFVYGTIATLIALAGFESLGLRQPIAAGAIIAVSAVATWFAHAYSTVLGERAASDRPLDRSQVVQALREAFPIVVAAVPATILAVGAAQGFWPLETAIVVANIAGIAVMAGAGLAAARATHASPRGTIVWVVASAAIGAAIVIVELAVHH